MMRLFYQLTNFRAFEDTSEFEIAPVTVLCGANSSGKSSILKSILLVKQSAVERRSTLATDAPQQPILFNGEWTRLGSWSNTVFGKEREREIGFRWRTHGLYADMLGRPGFPERLTKRMAALVYGYDLRVTLRSNEAAREELSTVLSRWTLDANGVEYDLTETATGSDRASSPASVYSLRVSNIGGFVRRPGSGLSLSSYYFGDLDEVLSSSAGPLRLGNVTATLAGPFVTSLTPRLDASWVPFFEGVVNLVRAYRSGMRGPRPNWFLNLETGVRTFRRAVNEDEVVTPSTATVRLLARLADEIVQEMSGVFQGCRTALATMWSNVRYLGPPWWKGWSRSTEKTRPWHARLRIQRVRARAPQGLIWMP
jgi:hypothetical protein